MMTEITDEEDYEGGNYKYCINCHRTYVKFLPDNYDWQYTRRCKLCERVYQQDFLDKYPGTKLRHRLKRVSVQERIAYEKIMLDERGPKGGTDE